MQFSVPYISQWGSLPLGKSIPFVLYFQLRFGQDFVVFARHRLSSTDIQKIGCEAVLPISIIKILEIKKKDKKTESKNG